MKTPSFLGALPSAPRRRPVFCRRRPSMTQWPSWIAWTRWRVNRWNVAGVACWAMNKIPWLPGLVNIPKTLENHHFLARFFSTISTGAMASIAMLNVNCLRKRGLYYLVYWGLWAPTWIFGNQHQPTGKWINRCNIDPGKPAAEVSQT